MKRLYPQPVPKKAEAPPFLVPEGDGKHAVKLMNELRARLFIKMDYDFRVRLSFENVSPRLQLATQRKEIEYFAVINCPDGLVFIGYRLAASKEVNDAQPSHPQGDMPVVVETVFIRAAMKQSAGHQVDFRHVLWLKSVGPNQTADATHDEPF